MSAWTISDETETESVFLWNAISDNICPSGLVVKKVYLLNMIWFLNFLAWLKSFVSLTLTISFFVSCRLVCNSIHSLSKSSFYWLLSCIHHHLYFPWPPPTPLPNIHPLTRDLTTHTSNWAQVYSTPPSHVHTFMDNIHFTPSHSSCSITSVHIWSSCQALYSDYHFVHSHCILYYTLHLVFAFDIICLVYDLDCLIIYEFGYPVPMLFTTVWPYCWLIIFALASWLSV